PRPAVLPAPHPPPVAPLQFGPSSGPGGAGGRSMRPEPRIGSGLVGWRRLTVVAALADAVVLFGYGLARGDRESLGLAVVMLVGLGLLRVGRGLRRAAWR